jgi:hypothetical protein
MPFDALVTATSPRTLFEALEVCGIVPVRSEVLATHKQAQLEKFGPSFWYRLRASPLIALVASGLIVGAMAAAVKGFAPPSTSLGFGVGLGWMVLMLLVADSGLVRLRAGSRWEERCVTAASLDDFGVPESIGAIARQLRREVPGSSLVLGELVREKVVLDPYLLLARGEERVCLGVWDGTQIISCANSSQRSVSTGSCLVSLYS